MKNEGKIKECVISKACDLQTVWVITLWAQYDANSHKHTNSHTLRCLPDLDSSLGDRLLIGNPGALFVSRGPEIFSPSFSLFLFFQFTFGGGNLCLFCSLVISHFSATWAQCMCVPICRYVDLPIRGLEASNLRSHVNYPLTDKLTRLTNPSATFRWSKSRTNTRSCPHAHLISL